MLVVDRVFYIFRREAVALQRLGAQPDAHLPVAEARELDAADPLYGLKTLGHYLVHIAGERLHVGASVVFDGDVHYRAVGGVVLVDLRVVAVVGELPRRHADLAAHVGRREVDVAVEFKLDDDHRTPLIAA